MGNLGVIERVDPVACVGDLLGANPAFVDCLDHCRNILTFEPSFFTGLGQRLPEPFLVGYFEVVVGLSGVLSGERGDSGRWVALIELADRSYFLCRHVIFGIIEEW
ncbi:hypothetical protein BRC64_07020 [Halobacteriales archaeon QH_10_67_22]|nr:MAG: hypothetical protein BRC64_07020 [Halobacteriales archaeon QH_10_67_22]